MRIALAVEGTRGDVYPMLGLGAALAKAGHDVDVCAPPGFREEVEAHGLHFRRVGADVHAFLAAHGDALCTGAVGAARVGQRFFCETIGRQFAELVDAARGAERLIAAGTQLSASSVAEHLGIPYRYVAYCPVMLPSRSHPPFPVPDQQLPAWMNALAWRLLAWGPNLVLRRRIDRERRVLALPRIRGDLYAHALTARPILAADAGLAEIPADCRLNVSQVGCLHPRDARPLPPKLLSFLDAGAPPVYFGFGSMTDPDPTATTRRILEAVDAVGCRALVSRGWAGLADGPLPDDVFALDGVAHDALFPRTAAVVHHGGAGTTTTAARAGVRQVVVPHVFDQFYWARRVESLGVGPPPLARRRLRAEHLVATLRATLDNELAAANAASLGEALRRRARTPLDLRPFLD